eukprot:scaffold77469_cov50-Attheya_sp.AAC.3
MKHGDYHYALEAASFLETSKARLLLLVLQNENGPQHSKKNLSQLKESLDATEKEVKWYISLLLDQERNAMESLRHEEMTFMNECDSLIEEDDEDEVDSQDMTLMEAARALRAAARARRSAKQRISSRKYERDPVQQAGTARSWRRQGKGIHRTDMDIKLVHDLKPDHLRKRASPPRLDLPDFSRVNRNDADSNARLGWENRQQQRQTAGDTSVEDRARPRNLYSTRSTTESLLFRLIVALQLCLVRIEEADNIICGKRPSSNISSHTSISQRKTTKPKDLYKCKQTRMDKRKSGRKLKIVGVSLAAIGTALWVGKTVKTKQDGIEAARTAGKAIIVTSSAILIRRGWMIICMNARLANSSAAIEEWRHQWLVFKSSGGFGRQQSDASPSQFMRGPGCVDEMDETLDEKSKRLLQCIPLQSTKGALRFLLLKHAMDIVYASVGTAIQVTKGGDDHSKTSSVFWMPIATAAAASYYALVGAGPKASQVLSSASSSRDVIQNAWGMVSLPAIKELSLQASRILKGAAIAERISIENVPCFIISRDPCPALSSAIKRYQRQQERELSGLCTILETSHHGPVSSRRRNISIDGYTKKDVIFHITGGGFFAHTIAGDLPYLIDWSGATNAVVICPEYALLPEHTFPVAINQLSDIYCSLVIGDAAPLLGFQADRIVITGESAGGNLAAALCVKLSVENKAMTDERNMLRELSLSISVSSQEGKESEPEEIGNNVDASPAGEVQRESALRLPDAMMLCCPALNLSLDLSPSRIMGTDDPVLPSGLISAISEAYLPGMDKRDPIASPYFAPDYILRIFPPTLLFASSDDPLLDDSVDFNARLRRLGVESDLRAVHNMPHAYWGLGTAGFPEAQQVQCECQEWLSRQFYRDTTSGSLPPTPPVSSPSVLKDDLLLESTI